MNLSDTKYSAFLLVLVTPKNLIRGSRLISTEFVMVVALRSKAIKIKIIAQLHVKFSLNTTRKKSKKKPQNAITAAMNFNKNVEIQDSVMPLVEPLAGEIKRQTDNLFKFQLFFFNAH
jgi:hypothetical protein